MMRLALVAFVIGCGGGSSGDDCRSIADCNDGLACSGADDGPVCGIPPREQCASNADCGNGDVCHAVFDSCSADQVGSECRPPCTADPECGTGFQCDAGSCIAQTCTAGFACEAREVCDPALIPSNAPVFDRHHACFAVPCDGDGDCDGRVCVNGTCQDAAGTCVEPMLVP